MQYFTRGERSGQLHTRSGIVHTPTFMPDGTRGAVKSLTPEMVASTGVQAVLANTYHLHLQPGEQVVSALGGLHAFTNQHLPLLTDSGGFQVFSLSKIRTISEEGVTFKDPRTGDEIFLSPEKSIQIQLELGADMIVAFDDVVSLEEAERGRTREAFERTHRWLERNIAEFKRLTKGMTDDERPLLFGVVQGGLDKALRKESLEIVQSLDVDGVAIGGLSVGESRKDMHDMLDYLHPLYDDNRPHFLLGVGPPEDIRHGLKRGIDMFDCVIPTRNARHASVWIHNPCTCADRAGQAAPGAASRPLSDSSSLRGSLTAPSVPLAGASQKNFENSLECKNCGAPDRKIILSNEKYAKDTSVIDPGCDCYTCQEGFSRGFLRHQFKVNEPLAGTLASIHNIRYLQRICEEYKNA